MRTIDISVNDSKVVINNPCVITEGNLNTIFAYFTFPETWTGLVKKVKFGDFTPIEIPSSNKVAVPMIEGTKTLAIKVFGYALSNEEYELIYSPAPSQITVAEGSFDTTGVSPAVPDPGIGYMTKAILWSGYSSFFATLEENVPQDIQDEYDSVDISVLTTAQVEAEIEKINNMLLDAQSVKYITVDTEQSGINKGFVNSVITVRTNGSLAGSGNIKTSATGTTAYIEVFKNTFTGLETPMKTDRLQIYADRIVYGKGSGGAITEDKTVYFPNTEVSGQNIVKFLTSGDIPDISGLRSEIDQIWGEIDWFYEYTDELAEAIAECYRKPDDGIPTTDLASDVQTSLGKADSAIQIHQDISGKADIEDIPTKTSDLTNDSGFITSSVNNLINYYKKTETYTQAEVNALINAITTIDIQVVQALPTEDISSTTIYLLPKQSSTDVTNWYDEYIYISNAWEKIGSTEVDLSNYYTKVQADGKYLDISSEQIVTGKKKWTVDNIHTLVVDKGSSADGGYVVANKVTDNPSKPIFSTYYKSGQIVNDGKVLTLPSAADGTLATVDEIPTALSDLTDDLGSSPIHTHSQYLTSHQDISGKADIADVPTALSELSDDSTHRLVTDAEKTAWNAKAEQFIPEKVYFVEESEGSAPSEPTEIDITSRLTYHGTYYINAAGVPTSSATNHCFKCDLSAYTPTQIKTATRSTSWYSYAFYSSDSVFDSATLISGGHNASASNGQGTMNYEVFNIGSIPNNAVTLLVVRYTDFDDAVANFFVKGYDMNDSSDDSGISTDSVSGCIEQWKSDNYPDAIIYKPTGISTHVYRVGSDRTYATLKAAVAQWVTDGKPCATIYVDSGIYTTTSDPSASSNELLIKGAENRLTIIGEDRDSTIVKSTTGKYIHPAINIQGGNVTVKNITFIADHSANSFFVYLDPDRAAQNKSPNSAYAVHCDGGSEADVVSGVIEFENCNMWSWQSCGLGCGTVVNGHVIVKNCDIRSFVPGKVTDEGDASGTAEQQEAHAIYVHGSRGAIVYHSSPKTKNGTTVVSSNESFTMVDTRVYLKGGTKTLSIEDNNKENFFDLVLFKNNIFSNGVESSNIAPVPNTVTLNALSAGNNISTLNSNKNGYSLIVN